MRRSHGIKAKTTDEAFQALRYRCFLWEGGAPAGVVFGHFNFQDL